MRKRISYCLLLLFITGIFSTCKKYPDGPRLSLRTKMARITGVWDLEYYEVDGIDSTNYVLNSPYYCRYYFKSENKPCRGDVSDHRFNLIAVNQSTVGSCCGWDWDNNKATIGIDIIIETTGFLAIGAYTGGGRWDVQRLTNKELWLKMSEKRWGNFVYSNRKYYMKLKKVSEKL